MPHLVALVLCAHAEELRYRVEVPDWPDAEATSAHGSVLLAPPPAGTRWTVEEAPAIDAYDATEAIEALGAAAWHEAGIGGAGVKVAIFDVQWFNAELVADELGDVTTHDCQGHRSCDLAMDTLRPRYSFEEGSHGVACAEVIHDVAPEAELHLVRVNGFTTMENAAEWAVREQIDVVSMSMSFFNTSYHDGSGGINGTVDTLNAGGVLLVNSAGNYAEEHWDGDFVDADRDGIMEFPWDSDWFPMYYGSGTQTATLAWDQFARCGDTDLDAYVYSEDGVLLDHAEGRQEAGADNCAPVERIRFYAAEKGWYYLRVVRHSGDANVRLTIFTRDGDAWKTTPGGLADPASHPSAFTVGAVRATGYLDNAAESFSSTGPSHAGVYKPDIAGPDGVSSSVYGPTGFYGTSASTPAVAGAIALLLSQDPTLTPDQAAERLMADAIGGRATWEAPDGSLGAGHARLPDPDVLPGRGPCGGRGGAALAWGLLMWPSLRRRDA